MIDSHCHIFDEKYVLTPQEVVANFFVAGGVAFVNVACDKKDFLPAIEFAKSNPNTYFALGYHPEVVNDADLNYLENLLKQNHKNLVALGEMGLDYYWTKDNKTQQKELFNQQIKLAKKYKLPIIVHTRDAFGDTLEILKANAPFEQGGVLHCYSGSAEFAKQAIDLGFYISFAGSVTYPNAVNLQNVAASLPYDKILIETDSPYLTPSSCAKMINEPKNVYEVAKFIANLRGIKVAEFITQTTKNALNLFKKIAT